jgi:hypothetical protein
MTREVLLPCDEGIHERTSFTCVIELAIDWT